VLTTFLEKIEKYHKNDIIVIPQNGNDFSRKLYSLGQMQHLEIPTRLMDWTFKELIALYFAVSSEMNDHIDGAVWGLVVSTDLRKNIDSDSTLDPLTEQNSYFLNFVSQRFLYDNFEVKLAEERIGAQGGRLLFQNFYNSLIPIEQNHAYQELLTKFIIPGKAKKLLRESLERIEEVDELKINTKSVMSNRDEIIEQIGKEIELEVLGCQ
jgi:hypothetical protein